MADKNKAIRKQPVSQKRVAVVLASLVGTMTVFSAMLLAMEGGALGTSVPGWAVNGPDIATVIEPSTGLREGAWNYIIIYESGDLAASADSLADGRMTGGPSSEPNKVRPKANFHFVVDSAESGTGTMDGALEVSTSWQEQHTGAPYAGWPDNRSYSFSPYNNAVGICLVGDLNRKPISEAQHQSLLRLVRELQTRLKVRKECVLFQWDANLAAVHARPAQQAYAANFRAALQ